MDTLLKQAIMMARRWQINHHFRLHPSQREQNDPIKQLEIIINGQDFDNRLHLFLEGPAL
jgi:hypothetical protein